jgi:Rod binding domain-containing protein
MSVDAAQNASAGLVDRVSTLSEDARLRNTCREVEGIFLGILMKSGLKPMIEGEDEADSSHVSSMIEATIEQVANQMAGTESLGIARMLYENVVAATGDPERKTS